MNQFIKFCIIITFFSIKALVAQSEGTICLAPYWGGILAGYSSEREVVKLYGNGVKLDSLGDTGCRYYADPTQKITMIVIFGTDGLVQDLKLISGFHPPNQINETEFQMMASDYLKRDEGFGYWNELHFGDSMDKVDKNLGPPQDTYTHSEIIWVYESVCHCELASAIRFGFKDGKLVSISFFQNFG